MSLAPDVVVDRRRLKRQLAVWRVIAIALGLAVVLVGVGRFTGLLEGRRIARLNVDGLILENAARDRALDAIADSDDYAALVVHINSPGGSVVGGEDLYNALRRVGAQKPVAVVMGTLATSAGYMTAIAGDRIFARESSITGSIGVLFQTTDVTQLLEKVGVNAEAIKSSPLKAQPSPLEPLTEAGRAATRAVVENMYEFFVDLVADRRGLPRPEALRLADGRVFTGRQAVGNQLVDEIGDERAARDWLEAEHGIGKGIPFEDIDPDDSSLFFSADLASSLIGKSVISKALRLDGLISLWHPELR